MAKLTVPIRIDALEKAKEYSKEFYDKGYQQGRADAIDDVERELLKNGFIATHHALEVWHEISEQLKEQK